MSNANTNTNTNTKNQTATIILQQLGGNRFIAMTGSKNFVAGENLLGMKLTRNGSGANYLRITLTSMDEDTLFINLVERAENLIYN